MSLRHHERLGLPFCWVKHPFLPHVLGLRGFLSCHRCRRQQGLCTIVTVWFRDGSSTQSIGCSFDYQEPSTPARAHGHGYLAPQSSGAVGSSTPSYQDFRCTEGVPTHQHAMHAASLPSMHWIERPSPGIEPMWMLPSCSRAGLVSLG